MRLHLCGRCRRPTSNGGASVRKQILLATVAVACLAASADAHFVLISPAASMVQNRLGDPQKIAPCGGVSANPGRGTPANPGVPSGAVTNVKGGTEIPLLVYESIYHPGHYRVALARRSEERRVGKEGRS